MREQQTSSRFLQWLPAVAMAIAVIVGYVQLSEAVKANARSLESQAATDERQAEALEQITQLLVNDARHDTEIAALRRDLTVVRQAIQGRH
jgi:hypothetical protein